MADSSKTTQEFVPIKEVRDGVVILKDGGLRALLLASSVNFALKSADEQTSIILQFQNFLNSLDFSVQMFIQSRRLDIRPYLALLEERYKNQFSDLLKIQTREYIEFIRKFTESTSIMSKSFFVVVPYTPAVLSTKKSSLFAKKNSTASGTSGDFEENLSQLEQRLGVVSQGLTRCGIRVVQLGTEEVIELFYRIFNPGDTEKPIPVT
jgi:type IV secretory pathway VirB4 component